MHTYDKTAKEEEETEKDNGDTNSTRNNDLRA